MTQRQKKRAVQSKAKRPTAPGLRTRVVLAVDRWYATSSMDAFVPCADMERLHALIERMVRRGK